MSNTITIDKAAIIREYRAANAETKLTMERIFGKDTFQSKDITDRIQNFFDVLELTDPDQETLEFINRTVTNPRIIGAVNFVRAELIAEAYNEGETPDATKDGVQIWAPFFKRPSLGFSDSYCDSWLSVAIAGARLGFKSEKLSNDAGKKFESVYRNLILKTHQQ